ncbi:17.8 kDa class I heat shock protein-like [Humulus lupulus]|uniref:17.8 kDa class I heat shock protein-like n=1 Tax=Humulus lupulus TaxID=3486 RepID=UPI002B40CD9A|nr:17.8 kDa class I heat shock protein-like [Humulus lupulus]
MSIIPNFFGRRSNVFEPFSPVGWDPFEGFPNWPIPFPLHQGSSIASSFPFETASLPHFQIDWKETPAAHVFKANVPGLRKEELKVEVDEGRVLQISGERKRKQEERTNTWHRVECSNDMFSRSIRLPEDAKVDQVTAAIENGVLTVTVPRQVSVRSIEISD